MTLEELYGIIGGDYEQAMKVMRMEKLVDRYIRKLPDNDLVEKLVAAGQSMDPTGLHESAHALKGVYANLGLVDLAAVAGEVCEEFRPGNERHLTDDEVKERIADIEAKHAIVLDGIAQYASA